MPALADVLWRLCRLVDLAGTGTADVAMLGDSSSRVGFCDS